MALASSPINWRRVFEPRRGAGKRERNQQAEQAKDRRLRRTAFRRRRFRVALEPGDADAPADHGKQQHAGKQAGHRQRHDHFDRHSAAPVGPPLWLDRDRGGQLKLQAGLGRQLQMFLALAGHHRAGRAAHGRANRRAAAATGNAADDRAEADTAANLSGGLLAFALALGFDICGDDLVGLRRRT